MNEIPKNEIVKPLIIVTIIFYTRSIVFFASSNTPTDAPTPNHTVKQSIFKQHAKPYTTKTINIHLKQ